MTTPQPDSAVAAGDDQTGRGSIEIPRDGLDVAPGDNESATGGTSGEPRKPVPVEEKFQAKYDRLQAKIGDIASFIDKKGLDSRATVQLLTNLEEMLGHEQLGPIVGEYIRTKKVRLPKAGEDSISMEDDEDFERPWLKDLAPLQEENQRLRSELHEVTRSRSMESITKLTTQFLEKYPMDEEQREHFQEALDSKVAAMDSEHGVRLLKSLNEESFRTLALPLVEPFLDDIVARRLKMKSGQRSALATDSPGISTNIAAEAPAASPAPNSRRDVNAQARAAMRRAFQQGA